MGGKLGAAAAILAGGRGLRMGGADKQSLLLGEEPLGMRAVRILGEAFDEIIVVTAKSELYAGAGVTCVEDIFPGRGPASGIHAALVAAEQDWVYVMGCDMPAFSKAWAERLVREAEAADSAPASGAGAPAAVYALYGRHMEPLHALYSKRLVSAFELAFASAGETSIRSILETRPRLGIPEAEARAYSPDWGLFSNINTPEDLERLRGVSLAREASLARAADRAL